MNNDLQILNSTVQHTIHVSINKLLKVYISMVQVRKHSWSLLRRVHDHFVIFNTYFCQLWPLVSTASRMVVVRWCWVKLPVLGVLLIWIIVGPLPLQWVRVLFGLLSFLSSSSLSLLSLGDGPIQTEILSQRAVKPKPTNHQECLSDEEP